MCCCQWATSFLQDLKNDDERQIRRVNSARII